MDYFNGLHSFNTKPEVKHYLKVDHARKYPYSDNSFDLVISINTVHNLPLLDILNYKLYIHNNCKNNFSPIK
ncbi:methyltransferase domain-containing protein [Crocosphaera watsonii]|uniref:methyltransferase domain-containing protein n=1 Tax=Crocosphaera watsonii TaxID=263511 RepID=UPI003AFF8D60